ncbi:hypothetical protein PENTCL1PPCAC_24099, partial [Pristionchus entomophagus]
QNSLSRLPDEVLLNILERLDHNDLDNLSKMNRRIGNLTSIARSRAKKLERSSLLISQAFGRTTFQI